MSAEDVISWALIALCIVDWFATVILVRAALRIKEAALEERAAVSVLLSIGASAASVIALGHILGYDLPAGWAFVLLAAGLTVLSVPQLIWVVAFLGGRFR